MKLCILGSGSTGNALLLDTGEALLVDCGLVWRDLWARAERVGFSLRSLRYVCITHEHGDHTRGLDALVRRGVTVVASPGTLAAETLAMLKGCELLVFETNHDLEMLLSGPYPWPLKMRILGPLGHLANDEAAQALRALRDWARTIFLAHLSQENNTPALALETVAQALGDWKGNLFLTYPDRPSAVVLEG